MIKSAVSRRRRVATWVTGETHVQQDAALSTRLELQLEPAAVAANPRSRRVPEMSEDDTGLAQVVNTLAGAILAPNLLVTRIEKLV
jgi:hypothetical protein